jgi:hypothetical protein
LLFIFFFFFRCFFTKFSILFTEIEQKILLVLFLKFYLYFSSKKKSDFSSFFFIAQQKQKMSISRNHQRTSITTSSLSPQPDRGDVLVQQQQQQQQYYSSSSSSSPSASQQRRRASIATSNTDPQTLHILKKFGLEEIMPKPQDFESARADLMPIDGSTPIFAGGRPISRRRESSSPAVTEALARGFKLTHFPARALLPEDQFANHSKNTLQQEKFFESSNNNNNKSNNNNRNSPDPNLLLSPDEVQQQQQKALAQQLRQQQSENRASQQNEYSNAARIPANIDPHVLPQGALMQPLPPARELLNKHIPLQQTTKYDVSNERWLGGYDAGDWALSDPVALTSMARIYRRCFPRTEKDDQYDEFPTSDFSGNFILRRYGGCFPPHCQYSFYRKYGEVGQGAASSEYHNFPAGRHPLAPI